MEQRRYISTVGDTSVTKSFPKYPDVMPTVICNPAKQTSIEQATKFIRSGMPNTTFITSVSL